MTEPFPLSPSLWAATAPPAPETPPLEADARADICVIGAGYAGLSTALHLAELVVHRDPQPLEGPRRAVDAGRVARDGAADDLGELRGGLDRRLGPGAQDVAGDAAGVPLLAELGDDADQLVLRQGVHQLGRARPLSTHPHVERPVGTEGEAALRLVELERRHAEVHHHAIELGDAAFGQALDAA